MRRKVPLVPSTAIKCYKNKQTTKVVTKPVHCCEKQWGKNSPPRQNMFQSAQTCYCLRTEDTYWQLNGWWQFTSCSLMFVSVWQPRSCQEKKVPYSFSSSARCNFHTPSQNRTASDQRSSKCLWKNKTKKNPKKQLRFAAPRARLGSFYQSRQVAVSVRPLRVRTASHPAPRYGGVRPCVCARAPAHTRAHRKRDNGTSARRRRTKRRRRRGAGIAKGSERFFGRGAPACVISWWATNQ